MATAETINKLLDLQLKREQGIKDTVTRLSVLRHHLKNQRIPAWVAKDITEIMHQAMDALAD